MNPLFADHHIHAYLPPFATLSLFSPSLRYYPQLRTRQEAPFSRELACILHLSLSLSLSLSVSSFRLISFSLPIDFLFFLRLLCIFRATRKSVSIASA